MKLEVIIPFAVVGLFALGLFYIGVSQWRKRKACREKIEGICVKKREHKPAVNKVYYCDICFTYSYGGKKYTHYSVEQFKGKKQEQFQKGKTYPLYVNPQKPQKIRCTNQMLTINDIICIVFGGFFLLALLGMTIEQVLTWIN